MLIIQTMIGEKIVTLEWMVRSSYVESKEIRDAFFAIASVLNPLCKYEFTWALIILPII